MRKSKQFFSYNKMKSRPSLVLRFGKHPFVIPIVTFLALFVLVIVGFILLNGRTALPTDAHIVELTVDGKERTVPTRVTNVGELLQHLQITLNANDVVEPAADTPILEDNFRVNVYRARPVTVVDGNRKTYATSAAATPRTIAKQAGVTVYPEDKAVAQPVDNVLKDGIGEQVVITRSVPISLNLYGTVVSSRTLGTTVGSVLKEKNIKLADGETVAPAANTPVTLDQQIFVLRKGTQLQSVQQDVPTPTETVEDASLTFGTTAIRQQGSSGKQLVTYIVNADGSKQQIQSVTIVAAVTQIIARGKAVEIPSDISGVMSAAGISSSDYAYVNYIISRESGWCPTKLQGQIGYCPAYAPASIPNGLGYGLGQATPSGKMASFGGDWQTNPVTQLRWATSYAVGRYGSWEVAYNHWYNSHNW
jgi:uncharacterized protein YabE (DUF348 family)